MGTRPRPPGSGPASWHGHGGPRSWHRPPHRWPGPPGPCPPPGGGPVGPAAGPPWLRRRHPLRLAMLIALVQVAGTAVATRGEPAAVDALGYALLAAGGLALAGRYRLPVPTLIATAATTIAYHSLGYPGGPTFVAVIVAGIAAAKAGRRYGVWAVAGAGYVAWLALAQPTLNRALVLLAWVAGGIMAAEWARVAGQYRARAMQVEQERARAHDEQQRRQASEERLRIAGELHDVLGHHLSLINVQAGVGLHLMDRSPEQARAALGTIKQASAEALREVRAVLASVHPTGEAAPRAPAPGLDQLADLTTDAGLPVETVVRGQPRTLPSEVDRAAYRVVREALTNVRRHAGSGASATVLIGHGEEGLTVQVDDDGGEPGRSDQDRPGVDGAGPVTEGNGIAGMRARVAALGGSLRAGYRPEGGFRVRAWLPLPPPADGAGAAPPAGAPDGEAA